MVVCKFFQQGYCRYGQNCRFEHIYGSKYTYHANPQPQAVPSQPTGCTDEQLVNQVQADVQSALRGGQWILSCYSPYKEKPVFPGISDLSPEEARLFIYEAKSNNTLDQAVTYMNNLFKETRQKYEQLLQPNINIIKVLRSLYKGETTESPFANTAQNTFVAANNAASSIFRSALQNTQPMSTQDPSTAASIFSQAQKSIFNTQPDTAKEIFSNANNTSIFSQNTALSPQNQNTTAKSIFSNAVQNTNNQFNTNQQNPSSIFSTANQNIFGPPPSQTSSPFTQTQNTSPFNQPQNTSPFSQNHNTSPFNQGNVFQKTENPSSIFSQANKQLSSPNEPGVYSKIEELSEADLECFKSDRFELGFVPELPPPYQLCNPGL